MASVNELREARPGEEQGILAWIQALAEYDREPDTVENTAEAIHATLFGASPKAFCYVVEADGRIVAIRASSGRCWIGTRRQSRSTASWAPSRWTSGPPSGSPVPNFNISLG